jgi:hypothetical protein
MPPRRVYPSWLPANPRERRELIKIRRRQILTFAWIVGFLPAGWILILITKTADFVVPLTVLWLVVGISVAYRVTVSRCPRCGEGFCGKTARPYWYALFTRRCEACGLSLPSDQASNE